MVEEEAHLESLRSLYKRSITYCSSNNIECLIHEFINFENIFGNFATIKKAEQFVKEKSQNLA